MTSPAPIRQPQADPFERHYTPKDLAELWRLDESTVRRIFKGVQVFRIGQTREGKRKFIDLVKGAEA
jgi:hypothetical protein